MSNSGDLCRNATVIYHSGEIGAHEAAKNIIDGNLNTKWCARISNVVDRRAFSDSSQHHIRFDLGREVVFNCYVLRHAGTWENKKYNTKTWHVSCARADNVWFRIDRVVNNTEDVSKRKFEPVTARYICIDVEESDQIGEGTVRLYEFEIYYEKDDVYVDYCYDVFLSHANNDKLDYVDKLYDSLCKLGVNIFYDKYAVSWGSNWKNLMFEVSKKAKFAIVVISNNFFEGKWTVEELKIFLARQNMEGTNIILPILHNISVEKLSEKYPELADIQAIDSSQYTCDEVALNFARQMIKWLDENNNKR